MSRLPEDRDPVPPYAAFQPPSAPPDGVPSAPGQSGPIPYAPPSSNPDVLLPSYSSLFRQGPRARWHTKPLYLTSVDRADSSQPTTAMYFRLPTRAQVPTRQQLDSVGAAMLPVACRCSERGDCACELGRGPIMFTAEYAERAGTDQVRKHEMIVKRTNDRDDVVARIKRGSLVHRDRWSVEDAWGKPWATVERKGTDTIVHIQGQRQTLLWRREQGLFDLIIPEENSFLVAQHSPNGALLFHNEHERMPQNYACDVDGCPFVSSCFGFVFRCKTCTSIRGDDTVDYCEAHLGEVCRVHQPTHEFLRMLPRVSRDDGDKGGQLLDADVRETPLLLMQDLMLERKRHELVVVTLAVAVMAS